MKKVLFTILIGMLLFACKKEDTNPDSWKTEQFKYDYTIQFPDNYSGGYVQGFEGGTFEKTRKDSRAVFSYNFSNGLQSFDFGDTLANESTDSIAVTDGDIVVFLPNRMEIIQDGDTAGILFYNEVWSISRGELYWKDGGVFKDALSIQYANDLKEEAISIVKTIKHN